MTATLFSGRSPQTVDLLLRRRSASAKAMGEPGPSEEEIAVILASGTRVPDHGKLAPWRFIRFSGSSRAAFGEALVKLVERREPDASPVRLETERTRFSGFKPQKWKTGPGVGAAAFRGCGLPDHADRRNRIGYRRAVDYGMVCL